MRQTKSCLKSSFLQAGVSGTLTEPAQVVRDTDLSPGQPLQPTQPSGGLGVIGRRSVSDLGAIGESLSGPAMNSGPMHDHMYNLQMLESAYYKLPQPRDSERARNYTPVRIDNILQFIMLVNLWSFLIPN